VWRRTVKADNPESAVNRIRTSCQVGSVPIRQYVIVPQVSHFGRLQVLRPDVGAGAIGPTGLKSGSENRDARGRILQPPGSTRATLASPRFPPGAPLAVRSLCISGSWQRELGPGGTEEIMSGIDEPAGLNLATNGNGATLAAIKGP
jgi:hypothetical protein